MHIRALIARRIGRLIRGGCKLLGRGGTDLPGRAALKICPDILEILSREISVIAVTGTNGKTTTARMLQQALLDHGRRVISNASGANLISGVTTALLAGRAEGPGTWAVLECDEASARAIFSQVKPKMILVTNLFRDQLDRYGEVTNTLSALEAAIRTAPEAELILNADCSLTASLARVLPNQTVWFGVEEGAVESRKRPEASDARRCRFCAGAYTYKYVTYGHLGGFFCPACGYRRRRADYAVTRVLEQTGDHTDCILESRGFADYVRVGQPGLYNLYNALAAGAAACEAGVPMDVLRRALERATCGFGRMERFTLGKVPCNMILAKNPAGVDQVMEYLVSLDEPFVLAVCLNDRAQDGRDISWIWDAEIERLLEAGDRLEQVILSGDRAWDMYLRFKYAGIPETRLRTEKDCDRLIDLASGQSVQVVFMPTYTAMLELRGRIIKRSGDRDFWEGLR